VTFFQFYNQNYVPFGHNECVYSFHRHNIVMVKTSEVTFSSGSEFWLCDVGPFQATCFLNPVPGGYPNWWL